MSRSSESHGEPALWAATTLLLTFKWEFARAAVGMPWTAAGSMTTLGLALVGSSACALLPRPLRDVARFLVLACTSIVLQIDLCYFRRFGELTSITHLAFASQLRYLGASVPELLRPWDALLWLDVLGAAVGTAIGFSRRAQAGSTRHPIPLVGGAAGIALLALSAASSFGGGVAGYHLADAVRTLADPWQRHERREIALASARAWLAEHRARAGSAGGPLAGSAAGRSVIVLQVESLQAFALGLWARGGAVAPALDGLASESLSFERFFEQTGQGTTADADLLAQCSLYPSPEGAAYFRYDENSFACLPTLLTRAGYATMAIQGIDPGFWNLNVVYPRIGIERYVSRTAFTPDHGSMAGLGLRDDVVLDRAAAELERAGTPVYAFIVTLTSHDPFDVSWIPDRLDVGDLEGTRAGRYLQAIHWTDAAIGRFVERLRESGVLDRSVLVVYGDHTGIFRDDDGAERLVAPADRDEPGWWSFEHRVPLLVRLPEGRAAGARHIPAGQVDIAPTLAGLLAIDLGSAPMLGSDLLSPAPRGTVFFHGQSALSETLLFVSGGRARGTPGCYDVGSRVRRPPETCRDLARESSRALGVSRDILKLDLVPSLSDVEDR
jgi:phosphoglycerol transferase MdoB-like AlkP superfamily enzyme